MRLVLDANVLLAGFGTRGLCEALIEACLERHELIASEHILGELERHLLGKFGLPANDVREVVAFVRSHATLVDPVPVPAEACPDPDDLPVLGTAAAAGADLLVTGDKALLAIESFGGIPIVSPRACFELLAGR